MENDFENVTTGSVYDLRTIRGFGNILLIFFISLWVVSLTALNLFLRWSIEQSMFEAETGMADGRWLVQLGYALIVFLPLLAVYFGVKTPRIKLMLGLWLVGGVFALLSTGAKTLNLTAQVQSYLVLALILCAATVVLMYTSRNKREAYKTGLHKARLTGSTILAGVGLATPWILWGALGSPLDTLAVIILGCSFAFFIVSAVFPLYLDLTQPAGSRVSRGDYLFDGFVLAVFLMIIVAGISQNGSQLLLSLVIPPAGWLIAALASAGRNRKDHGRLAIGIIASLILILPLAFFDMDELALIISGTTGAEVFYWAQRAASYSSIFLIALALVILVFFPLNEKANLDPRINWGLILLSIMEFFALYFLIGQPGFFGDRLFVIMKKQVDTNQLALDASINENKLTLYSEMTSLANASQSALREKLDKLRISYTPYYLVNAMEVNAGWYTKNMIIRFEGVDRVLDSPRLRPLPQMPESTQGEVLVPQEGTLWNLEMINALQVHEELGITGKGVLIGQTDSGVDMTHPELANGYRGKEGSNDYNWLDPWNSSVSPVDIGGHGTGTLGIIVGNTRGIAPDSEWIGCVNLARNLGNPALYLDCMQFMFAPYPQGGDPLQHGDPLKGAMIINNSWGCPEVEGCDPQVFDQAVAVLKSAGVFMSVAAGNNGYYGCSTITDPLSIYEDVFTVGAVDKLGHLSPFSSRGPVNVDGSGRAKPDLSAPGEMILVAAPGGTYTFSSGTSFAAPHVAGVVALMWSANPELIGDIETTTRILIETAQPYKGNNSDCGGSINEAGAGILDAYAAVKAAIALK